MGEAHLHPSPLTPAPDIRLDWKVYAPEDRADRLLDLLVFYGPPFPLLEGVGSDLPCPEAPASSGSRSPSLSDESATSRETAQSVRRVAGRACGPGPARGPWPA